MKTGVAFILTGMMMLPHVEVMADRYQPQRDSLIEEIKMDVQDTSNYLNQDSLNPDVLTAMSTVPRHHFVPPALQSSAYENRPLSIGYGQTISQPYIVAVMTDLLRPKAGHKVLEIGTGSGYQAAILAQLVDHVYSIEIIEQLGYNAKKLFKKLGYQNITTKIADGYDGWEAHAPFDGIIVTAAISHIPPPLVSQLAKGGRMVIPVGTRFQTQYLTLVEKDQRGEVSMRKLLPVIFVPFTGDH